MLNAIMYIKDLETAGFSREQAEATINIFFKFMEHEFATKQDLKHVEERLSHQMNSWQVANEKRFIEIDRRFVTLEQRLTIKMGAMLSVAVGFLGALIKLF